MRQSAMPYHSTLDPMGARSPAFAPGNSAAVSLGRRARTNPKRAYQSRLIGGHSRPRLGNPEPAPGRGRAPAKRIAGAGSPSRRRVWRP